MSSVFILAFCCPYAGHVTSNVLRGRWTFVSICPIVRQKPTRAYEIPRIYESRESFFCSVASSTATPIGQVHSRHQAAARSRKALRKA